MEMKPYKSNKGEMLVRAMEDEKINLEHFRRIYSSAKKTIDEIAKGYPETQKLEAVEKLVYESFWDDGKFGQGLETAVGDVEDSTTGTVSATTNDTANSSISSDENTEPDTSGSLSTVAEEDVCTCTFVFRKRSMSSKIRSILTHDSISETGKLLDVELRYVIGSAKHIFIVMPREPGELRQHPEIIRGILEDAHAFLIFWQWFVTKYAPINMASIAEYWLEPGNSTVYEYRREAADEKAPKFDIAAHRRALSYHASSSHTINETRL